MRNLLTTLLLALLLPAAWAQCSASFLMSLPAVGSGATPNTVIFTSTSSIATPGTTAIIGWNFGDGTTDTGSVVTHVYPMPGIYQLCITVFDLSTGCSDQLCQTIQVGSVSSCTAVVYPTSTAQNASFYGYLMDASWNSVYTCVYTWNFNDGSPIDTTLSQLVSHVFPGSGYYLVEFTATDTVTGCSATYSSSIQIANPPLCDAVFTWYENSFGMVDFSPNAIGYLVDSIDFGDGTGQSVNGSYYFNHIYPGNGIYNACRYVTDTVLGCTDTFCTLVDVQYALASPCFTSAYANYNSSNPLQLDFDGYYYNLVSGSNFAQSYVWDFGDGSPIDSTSGSAVSHVYATPGLYTICLTATDFTGCSNSYCFQQTTAGFTPPPTFCDVTFYGYEAGGGAVYFMYGLSGYTSDVWDFGDGTTSNNLDPLYPYHTYTANGAYTVCRTITDTLLGCSDSICQTVIVNLVGQTAGTCQSYFLYQQDPANATTYHFEGEHYSWLFPNISVTQWAWDFGDGTTDTTSGPNVSHTYAQAGIYLALLTTTDSTGCSYTYGEHIVVAGGVSYGNVAGQVTAGTTPLDHAMLYLVTVDPQTQLLYVIDSTYITPADSGMYGFNAVVSGFYTVKAVPTSGSAFYTGYAPTYFGDVMTWNAASFLFASPTQPYVANISLIPTNAPSSVGNGNIAGTIQVGANKTGSATLAGIHVMLMDENGNIAGHAISDADGNFTFGNLPAGTYTVYVDMMNRNMALIPMTLDAGNMTMSGLTVTVHSTQITVEIATSVNNPLADARVSLSPNPVQESATLRMTLQEASAAEVLILNALGQTMLRAEARLSTGENQLPLSLGDLAPGVYTVQVRANGQQLAVVRLVKE